MPVSGLSGDNLVYKVPNTHQLSTWYKGGPLVDFIGSNFYSYHNAPADSFTAPPRAIDGPLRIVINDVFKITTTQLSLSGKIESGEVENGDKVFIMPNADAAIVKCKLFLFNVLEDLFSSLFK